MKKCLIYLFTFLTIQTFGQSLFFDNIDKFTWTSAENLNDKTLRQVTQFGLRKLQTSKDSIKYNSTIWQFADNLTISLYEPKKKGETNIGTYKYSADRDNGLLQITLTDGEVINFKIGIMSTGNQVVLIRQKKARPHNSK